MLPPRIQSVSLSLLLGSTRIEFYVLDGGKVGYQIKKQESEPEYGTLDSLDLEIFAVALRHLTKGFVERG